MSRIGDVRDAVVAELIERLSDATIETFVVPHYQREDLRKGPRVVARSGNRTIEVDQGPDTRTVTVEIGVVGVTKERATTDEETYREAMVADCDEFDGLMEQVIALWTPNGPLCRRAMADHRFVSITQAIQVDTENLYSRGIWLSMVSLEYEDCSDE